MIAALGMYDMPAIQGVNDRLWSAIQTALGYGPNKLTRDMDFWDIWQSPDLLLAQTCGMPFRTHLHDKVTLVGTPDYGLTDCDPGYYRSVLITRTEIEGAEPDLVNRPFAFNEKLSQSGWAAPVNHLRQMGLAPTQTVQTGAHAASVQAVAEAQADWASIDALTWQLLQNQGQTKGLREVAQTAQTPGLPLITAQTRDPEPLRRAVETAIFGMPTQDRAHLPLEGLVAIPLSAYLAVPNP